MSVKFELKELEKRFSCNLRTFYKERDILVGKIEYLEKAISPISKELFICFKCNGTGFSTALGQKGLTMVSIPSFSYSFNSSAICKDCNGRGWFMERRKDKRKVKK